MNTKGREQVGVHVTDNLVAGNRHPIDVCLVTVKKGQRLKRGSVLAEDAEGSGKYVLLGTDVTGSSGQQQEGKAQGEGSQQENDGTGEQEAAGCNAAYILADDVDAEEGDAAGTVYRTGEFAENALILAEGYELTEKDRKALRDAGIFLSTIMM